MFCIVTVHEDTLMLIFIRFTGSSNKIADKISHEIKAFFILMILLPEQLLNILISGHNYPLYEENVCYIIFMQKLIVKKKLPAGNSQFT